MSGIATKTDEYVKLLAGTNTKVLDTRKTTPGMRLLEKEAVKIGGGVNHRIGLYDMIMLKDNHIDRITSYNVCYTKLLRLFCFPTLLYFHPVSIR